MSKQAWTEHMAELGYPVRGTQEQLAQARIHMAGCEVCQARKRTFRAARRRSERYDALRSLGLVKTAYGWE
jgi:hypothetical protein